MYVNCVPFIKYFVLKCFFLNYWCSFPFGKGSSHEYKEVNKIVISIAWITANIFVRSLCWLVKHYIYVSLVRSLCRPVRKILSQLVALYFVFSSPELKAQVSFSDHLSSVVCLSVRLSVCKLFTFSSSQVPQGQFQPNLAQSILG